MNWYLRSSVKADEKLPIAFVSGKLLKKMPEAYTDVRGQVMVDYQTYLEKVWVKKLTKISGRNL